MEPGNILTDMEALQTLVREKLTKIDTGILSGVHNKYDILSAYQAILSTLRGPDDGPSAYAVKWKTTARIRAIVAPHFLGDVNPVPLDSAQITERDIALCAVSPHLSCHYRDAVAAVKLFYGYDLKTEKKEG